MPQSPYSTDYQVNKKLRLYCKNHLRLTQRETAERVGTIEHSIGKIWRNRNEPSCMVLQGFANAFPCLNMNWVFRGEGEMEVGEEVTDGNLIEKVKHLQAMLEEKERYIKLLEETRKETNDG